MLFQLQVVRQRLPLVGPTLIALEPAIHLLGIAVQTSTTTVERRVYRNSPWLRVVAPVRCSRRADSMPALPSLQGSQPCGGCAALHLLPESFAIRHVPVLGLAAALKCGRRPEARAKGQRSTRPMRGSQEAASYPAPGSAAGDQRQPAMFAQRADFPLPRRWRARAPVQSLLAANLHHPSLGYTPAAVGKSAC